MVWVAWPPERPPGEDPDWKPEQERRLGVTLRTLGLIVASTVSLTEERCQLSCVFP